MRLRAGIACVLTLTAAGFTTARATGARAMQSATPATRAVPPAATAAHATPPATTATIHAGPVFTQGDDKGPYPHYPELRIQVDVPPGTDPKLLRPEAFFLGHDGGAAAGASTVVTLGATDFGVAAAFALDVSGSMKGAPLEAIRTGLTKFVGDAGDHDKIAIETIADDGRWDTDWNDSRDQAKTALAKLAPRGNSTRLWDSVLQAVARYPATPISRRLIVISDGHDEGSTHHLEEVIASARSNGVVIDAIGITRSSPLYLQSLSRMAAETGGVFRRANTTAELETLIGHGIERLRSTPVVSYRLDDLKADGQSHRFEVTWKHDGIESKASTTATLPKASAAKQTIYWGIGGGVLLLALAGAVYTNTHKRKQPPFPVQTPAIAAAVAPPPVAAPAYQRTATVSQAPGIPRAVPSVQPVAPPAEAVPMRPPARRASTEILARFSAPSAERPGAWLFAEEGPMAGSQLPLVQMESWIGALDSNQIPIPGDATVSANHACLVFDHDVLSVYDNNSTNGTWVNSEQIRGARKLLRPNDRIRVGKSTFAVEAAQGSGARV